MTTENIPPENTISPSKSTHTSLFIGLMFLTILICGAAFYVLNTKISLYKEETIALQKIQLSQNINAATERTNLLAKQYDLRQQIDELNKKLTLLTTQIQQQASSSVNTPNEHLFKVRYYLELATLNAEWSTDTKTTLSLINAADALLTSMQDNCTLAVRQAIAYDRAAQSALKIDPIATLAELTALEKSITDLPVNASMPNKSAPNKISKNTTILDNALNILQKLVVIEHNSSTKFKPMTVPMISLLKENLRFNLQTAEWAVLQQQQGIYDQALHNVIETLNLLNSTNNYTKSIIEKIHQLQNITIHPPKSTPLKALDALQKCSGSTGDNS